MKIGLILGGGGEVGVAWEIGVLAALERDAGYQPRSSAVIVGTSAGTVVSGYLSVGRELEELVAEQRGGSAPTIPVEADFGDGSATADGASTAVIPADITALLLSTEGTLVDRNKEIGRLAAQAPVSIDEQTYIDVFRHAVGDVWPEVDIRPTTVSVRTGETVLWTRDSGVNFPAALASSGAVPGFFPLVEINGEYYMDAPRQQFSAQLVLEKQLDAVIYVGLDLPILGNADEIDVLQGLTGDGLRLVIVTGGPRVAEVAAELMDPSTRPLAVEIGLEDGAAAAAEVAALLAG